MAINIFINQSLFDAALEKFMLWVEETKDYDTGRNDRFGEKQYLNKRNPVTLERFLFTNRSNYYYYASALKGLYGAEAKERGNLLQDFVNMHLLERSQTSEIAERTAIFQLVNNSRYQDVSSVVHEVEVTNKPHWLNASAGKIENKDTENQ